MRLITRPDRTQVVLPLLLCLLLCAPLSTPGQSKGTRAARAKGTQSVAVTNVNPGDVLISEFRFSGATGTQDEFVELYNNTDSEIVVAGANDSAGWRLLSSDGSLNHVIPNGQTIPARGHYLVVNSEGYSLAGYPGGATGGTTGDSSYSGDIPETGVGIALVRDANNITLEDRLDAVGPTDETEGFYKEGNGLAPVLVPENEYSYYRDLSSGTHADTDDNEADFLLVSTDTVALPEARVGAPGPENTGSPVQRNGVVKGGLVDPGCPGYGSPSSACARVRSAAGANPQNAAFGTLAIRRKFRNASNASITRLRFRVVNISTAPEASGADLRVVGGSGSFDANLAGEGSVTIQRLRLETPPGQPNGGGFNSTLSADTITLRSPLIPGNSINVEFLLGVQRDGAFRFFINVEALP